MKKSLLLILLMAASSTAAAQGFYMPIPYYGNNPYLFCTIGVPTDCWAPISPMTGAFTVTNPYCFNPVSAGLYATVCPQAFIGGGSASNLGSAPKVAEAGGDAASTDTN
jgi:hypothetical protein